MQANGSHVARAIPAFGIWSPSSLFVAGAGSDYLDVYGTESQPAMVYLTVHLDIQPLLDDGTLIVGYYWLTRAMDILLAIQGEDGDYDYAWAFSEVFGTVE
jgi:hypothetical protein